MAEADKHSRSKHTHAHPLPPPNQSYTNPHDTTISPQTHPGIAWESDVDHRFAQPDGFKAQPNPTGAACPPLGETVGESVLYTPPAGAGGGECSETDFKMSLMWAQQQAASHDASHLHIPTHNSSQPCARSPRGTGAVLRLLPAAGPVFLPLPALPLLPQPRRRGAHALTGCTDCLAGGRCRCWGMGVCLSSLDERIPHPTDDDALTPTHAQTLHTHTTTGRDERALHRVDAHGGAPHLPQALRAHRPGHPRGHAAHLCHQPRLRGRLLRGQEAPRCVRIACALGSKDGSMEGGGRVDPRGGGHVHSNLINLISSPSCHTYPTPPPHSAVDRLVVRRQERLPRHRLHRGGRRLPPPRAHLRDQAGHLPAEARGRTLPWVEGAVMDDGRVGGKGGRVE